MKIETIVALVSYLFSFGLVILFGRKNYQSYYQEKYSFLNHFPYEMNDRYQMKINNYFRLVAVIMGVSSIFLQITLLGDFAIISHIMPLVIGSLASLFLMTLFFVTMRRVEAHMFIMTMATSFSILSFISLAYFIYATPLYIKGKMVYIVLALALAMIEGGMVFSPTIRKWYRLEKKDAEDETYQRPRIISLASLEWLLFPGHALYLLMLLFAVII